MNRIIKVAAAQASPFFKQNKNKAQITSAKRIFDAAGHYARPDVFKFSVNRKTNNNMDITD